MKQVIFGGRNNALHTTNTQENALCGGANWDTSPEYFRTPVGSAGVLKNLRVKLDGSPGAGKHYDFTILVNGNPSAVTVEIADAATTGNSGANTVAIVAGDLVSLECNPDTTPSARDAAWTCVFEGTTANESLILGGPGSNSLFPTSTEYSPVMGGRSILSGIENDKRQVCPAAGVIKNLYVVLGVDPGDIGVDAYRFTLRLNGATVAESLIVTITADDTTGNDTSHNLVVAAGDILTMMIEPLNTPSIAPFARWGMTFLADIDGESIVLSGTSDDLNDTATEYIFLQTGADTWNATEGENYQLGQACTFKKLYVLLSGTPGSGKDYTFTARIAGGGTVVAIVADAATTGNSSALEDTVADDDYVSLRVVPTGTPTVRDAYWGFVSFIEPAAVVENKSGNIAAKLMAAGVI